MNSDLRMLYDAYGREYKNPQFNQYRQSRMKSQHAKLTLFKDAEGVRNWCVALACRIASHAGVALTACSLPATGFRRTAMS